MTEVTKALSMKFQAGANHVKDRKPGLFPADLPVL